MTFHKSMKTNERLFKYFMNFAPFSSSLNISVVSLEASKTSDTLLFALLPKRLFVFKIHIIFYAYPGMEFVGLHFFF